MLQNQIFENISLLLDNKMTIANFVDKYGNQIWPSTTFLNGFSDLIMFKIKSPIHYLIENDLPISIKLKIIKDIVNIVPSLLDALYYFSKPLLITPLEYIIMFDLPNICKDIPDDETHQIKYDDIIADEFFQLFVLLLELGSNVEIQEKFIEKLIQDESINQYKYLNILIKFGSNMAIKKIKEYKKVFKKNFIKKEFEGVVETGKTSAAEIDETSAAETSKASAGETSEPPVKFSSFTNRCCNKLIFNELKMDIELPDQLKKININKIFKACIECGIKAKFICDGCKLIRYCSINCQIKNWEHHKKICKMC
jgi:hypothetical protein